MAPLTGDWPPICTISTLSCPFRPHCNGKTVHLAIGGLSSFLLRVLISCTPPVLRCTAASQPMSPPGHLRRGHRLPKTRQWSLFPESGHNFKAFRHVWHARPPLQPRRRDHARQRQFFAAHSQADTLEQRKLIGAKPPLRQKHVWAIRTKLQIDQRIRDLAMFNLAIDSKLRGCDVVASGSRTLLRMAIASIGRPFAKKKTGRPVRFELTGEYTPSVDGYIRTAGKKPGEFLFTGPRGPGKSMTPRQYARLLSEWIASIGLDPHLFRHPLPQADKGYADLSPHRQPAGRAVIARPHQD